MNGPSVIEWSRSLFIQVGSQFGIFMCVGVTTL